MASSIISLQESSLKRDQDLLVMQRYFAVLYRTELFLSSVYIQVVMDGTEPADNKEVISG